jgi:hypothetical protein
MYRTDAMKSFSFPTIADSAAMLAMLGLLLMATHLTLGIALTASELFRRNAAA